jgi:predicted nucleotidyltransferase
LSEPTDALQRLAGLTGAEFPHLMAARDLTRRELERVREALVSAPCPADASVVVFGSWGRGELTQGSDDDWAILVEGSAPDGRADVGDLDAAVREVLGADARKPERRTSSAARSAATNSSRRSASTRTRTRC